MSSRNPPSWLKPTVDYAPLAVFLLAYELRGLMVATIALMVTTACSLILSLAIVRKIPMVPLITAVVVGVFGGLTLWLHDDTFIKMKPTIVYGVFALVVGGGLLSGKMVLKSMMGSALLLDDEGWRRLSLRFVMFFVAMAMVNEVARRMLSTDMWVLWKVPGSIVATFLFMLAQMPLIQSHRLPESKD